MRHLNMSLETYVGENYTKIIQRLNYNRMIFQLPVIVFLTIIMAVSLVGNSLVIAVYKPKFKKRTSSYFIMVLAIVDLCSCLCIPFVIFDLAHPYMHPVPVLCKINRFMEAWTSTASGLVLVCIAFDRYFHVCNPMGIYSIKQAQSLTIVMLAVGVSVSWPILFLAGKRTVPTSIPGLYGVDCSYRDEVSNSIYTLLFQSGLFFAFFVNFWIFCVFYARIFYAIYKRSHTTIGEHISTVKNEKPAAKNKHKIKYRFNNKPFINSHKDTAPNCEDLDIRLTHYALHPQNHQEPEGYVLNNAEQIDVSYIPVIDETNLNRIALINGTNSKYTSDGYKMITEHLSGLNESDSNTDPVRNEVDSKPVLDDMNINPLSVSNGVHLKTSPENRAKASLITEEDKPKSLPVLETVGSTPNPVMDSQKKRNCNKNVPAKTLNSTSHTNKNALKIRTSRTTIILAIVTLTAVLGFMPYLVVSLVNNYGSRFEYGLPIGQDLLMEFCYQSYFLNGGANPIIYSVMNPAFRHDSLVVLKKIAGIFRRK